MNTKYSQELVIQNVSQQKRKANFIKEYSSTTVHETGTCSMMAGVLHKSGEQSCQVTYVAVHDDIRREFHGLPLDYSESPDGREVSVMINLSRKILS